MHYKNSQYDNDLVTCSDKIALCVNSQAAVSSAFIVTFDLTLSVVRYYDALDVVNSMIYWLVLTFICCMNDL